MIFHFRRMDATNGWVVSLENYAALEITVLMDDGYRRHARYEWEIAVRYDREI